MFLGFFVPEFMCINFLYVPNIQLLYKCIIRVERGKNGGICSNQRVVMSL